MTIKPLLHQSNGSANLKGEPVASARITVIAEGLRIVGQNLEIISENKLQLDANITGNLFAAEIVIGASGRVNGIVVARRVEVHGAIVGAVYATDLVIGNDARVDGDVHYESLVLAQGGTLEGALRRLPENSALPQPSSEQALA
jgi:cytoskeletal protein CcmA (bactofilin family)